MAWRAFSPEILTHQEPDLKIRVGSTQDSLQLSTDGHENVNSMTNGRVHKSTSRWEGDTLVTRWRMEQNGSAFTEGSDVRTIAQGGHVLVDDRAIRTPWAEAKYHIVWVRKQAGEVLEEVRSARPTSPAQRDGDTPQFDACRIARWFSRP
jgi:hypothetical protein